MALDALTYIEYIYKIITAQKHTLDNSLTQSEKSH